MTKTAKKKNKRGARGSTEEESSVAKKPNIAEHVDESGVDNEEESTVFLLSRNQTSPLRSPENSSYNAVRKQKDV